MWPRSWREWQSRLVQPFVMHAKVSRLRVDGTAGNIAVVCAPDGFPEGGAAVCHMSQEAFVPTISNERGLLSVVSKPSVFSFAKQSAQINTLCLVSAATTHVDLKLTAGEVWVFGDLAGGAVPLEVCSARVRAGDVTIVNVLAASISASNKLGDVNLILDLPAAGSSADGSADSSASSSDGSSTGSSISSSAGAGSSAAGGPGRQACQVSAATLLGDSRLTVSAPRGTDPSEWLACPPGLRVKVCASDGVAAEGRPGAKRQRKWMTHTGKRFFPPPWAPRVRLVVRLRVHALPQPDEDGDVLVPGLGADVLVCKASKRSKRQQASAGGGGGVSVCWREPVGT